MTFTAAKLRESIALEDAIKTLAPGDWVKIADFGNSVGEVSLVHDDGTFRFNDDRLAIPNKYIIEVRKPNGPLPASDDAGERPRQPASVQDASSTSSDDLMARSYR